VKNKGMAAAYVRLYDGLGGIYARNFLSIRPSLRRELASLLDNEQKNYEEIKKENQP